MSAHTFTPPGFRKYTDTSFPPAPSGNPVLGIDPGLKGAFVLFDGEEFFEVFTMPVVQIGKEKRVDFGKIILFVKGVKKRFGAVPTFLERAKPMAMGAKFAFNYGRDFEKISLALFISNVPVTLVEPSAWAREMHDGIDPDLKPKAKSLLAVRALYPSLVGRLPVRPRGKIDDGPVDALLIAGYGLRKRTPQAGTDDFW